MKTSGKVFDNSRFSYRSSCSIQIISLQERNIFRDNPKMRSHPREKLSNVYLTGAGVHLIKTGHLWLYQNHIQKHAEDHCEVVAVLDEKGNSLGTALYSPKSRVVLRVLSYDGQSLTTDFLEKRIAQAFLRRQVWFQTPLWLQLGPPDAYRLVHAEADQLPGLFIDRYAHSAVIQTTTRAMDSKKQEIAHILQQKFGITQVICRDDGSNRDMEQLPREKKILLGSTDTKVRFHDAGANIEADLLEGKKTGSFLDQQENHAFIGNIPKIGLGTALDVCTYQGGFALALARAGYQVTAIDESAEMISKAERNAHENQRTIQFFVKNAFDYLRVLESQGQKFSVIVLDPPALVKRGRLFAVDSSQMMAAKRAYKELNLRALRLLEPGGFLLSCSCSGSLSSVEFQQILLDASRDAGKSVQLLEKRGASQDHPVLLGLPETEYLKAFFLRVLPAW